MESEAQTRRDRIDVALRDAGWTIVPHASGLDCERLDCHAVEEFPTANGPADYALFVDGRLVGIAEAKKASVDTRSVLTQAERYSRGLKPGEFDIDGYRAPFLYATNGDGIFFRDVRPVLELSRRIARFHTPDAIRERLARDFSANCETLLATPNETKGLRPYQRQANHGVEEAIAAHKRRMLVAMATGTGKTFTTVNQVYRLMRSGVARRVLFLVDRRALAAQAVRAFASFEPEPGLKFDQIYEVYSQRFQREDFDEDEKFDPKVLPPSYLLSPKIGHAFVYVCTIQRLVTNLFGRQAAFALGDEEIDDDAEDGLDIPIHAFDCIVADECHRGYTSSEVSVWRKTLDHFDAVKIGLTATPAAHTKAYFDEVVFRYTFDEAVKDGYLVDYDAVKIRSGVRMDGLFLNEGEQVSLIDPESGAEQFDLLEDEREFDSTEIERKATAPESTRLIVEELKKYAEEHERTYGRFPKTLIFAVNDLQHRSHANQLVEACRKAFGRGENFVEKITGRVDRPLQRIREFRNRPKPGIVVTVDMLTTGVDIPDLEFLVFLRPVKSRILFEQMLGRGTRRGERHPDKSHFVVFDCFDGTLLESFRKASAMDSEPPGKPRRTIAEIVDDIWRNRDRRYNVRCLVRRLQRVAKEMDGSATEMFATFIPEGNVAKFATNLPGLIEKEFPQTLTLLRNGSFQDLLENYPRASQRFLVAHDASDTVTSEWLIRDGQGKEHKPTDYLEAFAKYVRENPDRIDAVAILLDRPQEWGTDALDELRSKFAASPLRFTLPNLQKAHQATYRKLADIISMVKHAANEEVPLLTAAERVDAAIARLSEARTFTADQSAWLERIRQHLTTNLSIDRTDFDDLPVFAREGGWSKANRAFDNRLAELLRELNGALAA